MMTRRAAILAACAALPGLAAKKKDKGKRKQEPLGLISGTVFDADGRSLPGAKVTVTDAANPKAKLEAMAAARGEFNVRAPAEEELAVGRPYVVRAEAKGFEPAEKTVEVYQAQRTTVNLLLDPKK
jgi:hypothetical protein